MLLNLNYPYFGYPISVNRKVMSLALPAVTSYILAQEVGCLNLSVNQSSAVSITLNPYQKFPLLLNYVGSSTDLTLIMPGKEENYELKITKAGQYLIGENAITGNLSSVYLGEAVGDPITSVINQPSIDPSTSDDGKLTASWDAGTNTLSYSGKPWYYPADASQSRSVSAWYLPWKVAAPTGITVKEWVWVDRPYGLPDYHSTNLEEINWSSFQKPGVKTEHLYWIGTDANGNEVVIPQDITLNTLGCEFDTENLAPNL